MGLLVNKRKVRAAASSMHQFLGAVRSIFIDDPDEAALEAATVYLYDRMARDVFGNRFTEAMRDQLQPLYKFASPAEIDARVGRIERVAEAEDRIVGDPLPEHSPDNAFTEHVRRVIRSLLFEAGYEFNDPHVLRATFPRFEETVRRIKTHLTGIKNQHGFMMR